MGLDLQKANLWKRISAYLFDVILLGMAVVGFAWLLSVLTGFDGYTRQLNDAYLHYETEYGVTLDVTAEAYAAMPEADRANYDAALSALSSDRDAIYAYHMLMNLSLLITSLGFLFAYLALELAVPLAFGNGQTLGKKIFGIALMRIDGVKINPLMLFVRTVLGKYTLETMIPVLIVLLILWGSLGRLGTVILVLILLLQLVLVFATRGHSLIHDLLAATVAVDYASQMIFPSEEALLAYKEKRHAELAERSPYA